MKDNNTLLASQFKKETLALCTRRLRTACLVGIILLPLFGLLDKIIIPDKFIFFMILRAFESSFVFVLFLLSYTTLGEKHPSILAMSGFLSVGLIFGIMIRMTGGYESTYYAGLNLIILLMVLVMPWNLRQIGFACLAIYLFYLFSITNFQPGENISVIVNNHMFLLSTMFIALTASYLNTRLRFQEFTGRYELQRARDRLEEAYSKLKELDSLKTQFFSNISHELRTPLTLILAPTESVLKGEGGSLTEHGHHLINTAHGNALRLLNLINNLLDLSKVDAGKMKLNYEKLDLNTFVRGIVTEVLPLTEKKNLSLRFGEGRDIPQFYFDPDKIEKVLLNLFYNAIKFTDAKGKITISSYKENNNAVVKIADTGIGIEGKDLDKIFDRFVQLDGSSRRRYEGTGIGLTLAKEFVELHKGSIKVDSKIGIGTTVTFSLPLVMEYKGEEETIELTKKADDWTKTKYREATYSEVSTFQESEKKSGDLAEILPKDGKKILIVEDNKDMLDFVAIQLKNEYKMLKALDGQEGWEIAQKEIPDLIIADIMMPVMDGYGLCQRIKNDEKTKHIPIIFLTAKASMEMKIEGYEKGADEYLTKPFNSQELRARVKSLLNLRKLEKDIQERSEELERTLKQLKETQVQLVHSEKMASLGQLVAGIAHEMNNPIHASLMSAGGIDEYIEQNKGQFPNESIPLKIKNLNSIVTSGLWQAAEIVSDLKDFSKKDTTGFKPEDVHKGLDSTLHLLHHRFENHIVVHKNYDSEIGNIECSLGQLNQVFLNILQNAIDAIKDKGDIWITTRKDGDRVKILIRDNGIGIKEEDLKHIFEPFFTTKDVGEGVGLGMSISYRLIQNHNGFIDVKSKHGEGTEIIITLPIKHEGEKL